MEPFNTTIYEKDPEKPGYLRFVRMATYQELFNYCEKALKVAGLYDELEYFSIMRDKDANLPLPRHLRWLVVFAVTGGSEGHYIHVETIYDHDESRRERSRKCVLLGKDLSSKMDTALKVVNTLAPLLS